MQDADRHVISTLPDVERLASRSDLYERIPTPNLIHGVGTVGTEPVAREVKQIPVPTAVLDNVRVIVGALQTDADDIVWASALGNVRFIPLPLLYDDGKVFPAALCDPGRVVATTSLPAALAHQRLVRFSVLIEDGLVEGSVLEDESPLSGGKQIRKRRLHGGRREICIPGQGHDVAPSERFGLLQGPLRGIPHLGNLDSLILRTDLRSKQQSPDE